MLRTRKPDDDTTLDDVIADVLNQMKPLDKNSDEFIGLLTHLEKLYKLEGTKRASKRMSPDQMGAIAGNLAGILLMLNYERANVITSKVLGFIIKAKV